MTVVPWEVQSVKSFFRRCPASASDKWLHSEPCVEAFASRMSWMLLSTPSVARTYRKHNHDVRAHISALALVRPPLCRDGAFASSFGSCLGSPE